MMLILPPGIQIFIDDAIKLGDVYFCGESHDEIFETIFWRGELNYDEFILEVEVEMSDNESECNDELFPLWCN